MLVKYVNPGSAGSGQGGTTVDIWKGGESAGKVMYSFFVFPVLNNSVSMLCSAIAVAPFARLRRLLLEDVRLHRQSQHRCPSPNPLR